MTDSATAPNPTRLPGIPRKPLDNPRRPKPLTGPDAELARELALALHDVPARLDTVAGERFPLLNALARAGVQSTARQLLLIAAQNHKWADERRTAEYLLRHRDELRTGTRSAEELLSAARCAAEMDARRTRQREIPVDLNFVGGHAPGIVVGRVDDPSVGEVVVGYLRAVIGQPSATAPVTGALLDAVTVAIELSERHELKRGCRPSVLAMRSDARRGSRLGTRLCDEFRDPVVAASLARLLVGPDRSPIEASLLWWVAHPDLDPDAIPPAIRERWARDLAAGADPSPRADRRRRSRLRAAGTAAAPHPVTVPAAAHAVHTRRLGVSPHIGHTS